MAIYKGDVGTEVVLDTELDLTEAVSVAVKAKKPSGAEVTWTATVHETTKVRYVTDADDLNQAGTWYLQAYVETSEWTSRGKTVAMEVLPHYA